MSPFTFKVLVWLCVYVRHVTSINVGTENLSVNTVQEWDDPLLLVATLNGSFYGVGQKTGYIRWKLEDEPVVKVPIESSSHSLMPFFLPDPRDGSLYMLRGGEREGLKKLPFTIPQLVASSPCKSSDGILYTGKKSDAWYAVDPKTGFKEEIISFNNVQKMCPLLDSDSILVGRTEYNILMYDSKIKERKWNVTFYDYSSNTMDPLQVNSYGLVHFTASSTGHTMTLDRHLGSLSWENDFGSPVIAMYVVENNGLLSVPFTSVAEETLQHLQSRLTSQRTTASDMQLYPTLYVGEHDHGLYALLSLVDEHTPTIAPGKAGGLLLLEGPSPVTTSSRWTYSFPVPGHNMRLSPQNLELPLTFHSLPRHPGGKQSSLIVLGHYSLPELSQVKVTPQITGRSDPIISPSDHGLNGSVPPKQMASVGIQTEDGEGRALFVDGWKMLRELNVTFIMSRDFLKFSYRETRLWVNQQENKGLKILLIILFGCIFSMFWYLRMQMREFQNFSQSSRGSGSGSQRHAITAMAEDVGGGQIRVGKIVFDMEQVLGKGCEGTFVYKGQFESRAVAVKRLLPECFTFADREVSLLRESDEHANVVRYFCMEQDKQFRYIALELCAATVQDYVEGRFNAVGMISPTEILRQATAGVHHLHSLDIVHRDIKPHNVLISMPNAVGEVRAMISDFGLCKKLKVGRMSFSRRSGVTGTDGWIAPEMMVGNTRTTCAVDIFSLGCVIYYVLSCGKHPFGDALRRQANILSGESKLSDVEGANGLLCRHLVSVMLHRDPAERPSASAVLKHPLFWSSENVLTFLQDVSDRTEGVEEDNWVLKSLEANSSCVVREDWRYCIDTEVAQDLRKYRSYRGNSVRDLLRALRNKKHHYRELSQEAQRSLGEVPRGFVQYWTTRFPLLVLHSWLAMQCIKAEPVFAQYYHDQYVFQSTAPAATASFTTDSVRPRSKSPAEALSWRREDDPVRRQYLVSTPKWSSRRVTELKLESSRARVCSSDTDLSSLALLDADTTDTKLSRDCTKLNKRKGNKKKSPDVPLAWKLQSEDT